MAPPPHPPGASRARGGARSAARPVLDEAVSIGSARGSFARALALGVLLALAPPSLATAQQSGDDEVAIVLDMQTTPEVVTPPGEPAAAWMGVDGQGTGLPKNMFAPESGWRYDDVTAFASLHFDGVDDVLEIEPAVEGGSWVSFEVLFRQVGEPAGAYHVIAMFSTPSSPFALVISMDEQGRVALSPDGMSSIVTEQGYADGEWHTLTATHALGPDGTREATLHIDDPASDPLRGVGRDGAWPAGEAGTWHVGGPSAGALSSGFVGDTFSGDVAYALISHSGLGTSFAAPPGAAEGDVAHGDRAGVSLTADATSSENSVRFTVGVEGAPDATLVAIDETGAEHVLGAATGPIEWEAPRGAGLYRFEAREAAADGSYAVVAETRALAMPPPRPPFELLGAVFAATAVVAASSALASRGIDIWKILRGLALGRAEGRFHAATKDRFGAEKALRVGSLVAVVVGVLLMSVILTAGRLRDFEPRDFLAAFLVAGLAVIAFTLAMTGAQAVLARVEKALPKYRLWISGTLSLALSTLLFGIPFGYTGYLAKDRPEGAGAPTAREAAFSAITAIAIAVAAAPFFLAVGAFTRFAFAEIAVALALGGVFVSTLPIRPLPGRTVWAWSATASLALLMTAFVLQSAYHLGQLGAAGIVGAGGAAAAVATALTVSRVRTTPGVRQRAAAARPR